jgi:hypothetical protein
MGGIKRNIARRFNSWNVFQAWFAQFCKDRDELAEGKDYEKLVQQLYQEYLNYFSQDIDTTSHKDKEQTKSELLQDLEDKLSELEQLEGKLKPYSKIMSTAENDTREMARFFSIHNVEMVTLIIPTGTDPSAMGPAVMTAGSRAVLHLINKLQVSVKDILHYFTTMIK